MRGGDHTSHRMTGDQMAAKVAEFLEDQNNARFPAATLLRGLNDAVCEFSVRTGCKFDAIDIEFVDGMRDYDVKAAIDTDGTVSELAFIARIGKYDGSIQDFPHEFLKGMSLFNLDRFGLTTVGDGGAEAWHNDMVDFHKISIVPVPDADYDAGPPKNNGAYVLYNAVGDLMTYVAGSFSVLDTDIPTLAQLDICYGAAAFILEFGGKSEVEKATEYFEEFEKGIAAYKGGYARSRTQYGGMEAL
jgi:hypothetical protein